MLCSYLGSLVERGEYFSGEEELKKTIENVCFNKFLLQLIVYGVYP